MGPVLELRACQKAYLSGRYVVEALKPTDLEIGRGEYIAITGPSGSGKSTLLNLLGLLVRPSDGRVVVEGRDTSDLTDAQLSAIRGSALGFVFQAYHLLQELTALENVELPLVYDGLKRAARRRIAMAALHDVSMSARAYGLPPELSGGERQRVAIARAVVRQPPILLCDEPTGNLDSVSAERVMALLDQFNQQGVTIIVVTHSEEVAGHARRRVWIKDGIATVGALA